MSKLTIKTQVRLLAVLASLFIVVLTGLHFLFQVKVDQPIRYDNSVHQLVLDVHDDTEPVKFERIVEVVVDGQPHAVNTLWLKPDQQSMAGKENFDEFYHAEQVLYEAINKPVHVITESGRRVPLTFQHRKISDYPATFWLNRVESALMMFFSLWIFFIASQHKGAWAAVLGSYGLGLAYLVAETSMDRVWAVPITLFKSYIVMSELVAIVSFSSIFYLAWHLPKPLSQHPLGKYIPICAALFLCVMYALFRLEVIMSLKLAFEIPYVLVVVFSIIVLIYKFVYYFFHRKNNLIEWTVMRWTILAVFFGISIPLVCHLLILFSLLDDMPRVAYDTVVIFKVGLSALVATHVIYQLESWWWRFWLVLSGFGALIMLFFVFSKGFGITEDYAWLAAFLCTVVVVFLMRQYMKHRYSLKRIKQFDTILPKLINVSSLQTNGVIRRDTLDQNTSDYWSSILKQTFNPLEVEYVNLIDGKTDDIDQNHHTGIAQVTRGGLAMSVIDKVADQRILLLGAYSGMHLFCNKDVEIVEYFWKIFQKSLNAAELYLDGERNERRRIAADLHDDIGGKLLHLASGTHDHHAYAQDALTDLRMLARGLSGNSKPFANTLADINYIMAEQCDMQDVLFQAQVDLSDATQRSIPTRAATLLTSICHELVRNALKHHGVSQVSLVVETSPYEQVLGEVGLPSSDYPEQDHMVTLAISNNGAPTDPTDWIQGVGIPTIQRRIDKIQGHVVWAALPHGGVSCELRFVLSHWLGV